MAGMLLGVAGCGERHDHGPPTVHIGEDICAECGMIISDERFACAIIDVTDDDRVVRLYDDIGEMLKDFGTDTTDAHRTVWVRDFVTGDWVAGQEAVFLVSPELSTPMGSGVAAFSERSAAKDKLREFPGEIHTFETMPR